MSATLVVRSSRLGLNFGGLGGLTLSEVPNRDLKVGADIATWPEELQGIFGRNPAWLAPSYAEHEEIYSMQSRSLLQPASAELPQVVKDELNDSGSAMLWLRASCACAAVTAATTSWSFSNAASRLLSVVQCPAQGPDGGQPGRARRSGDGDAPGVSALPILLRLRVAAQTKLLMPMLQVVHRIITCNLFGQRV